MNTAFVFSLLLLVVTVPSVWPKKWRKNNGTCKRCSWFKPACMKPSDDFIKLNCYQGLFKTIEEVHKDLEHINYKCKRGLEVRDILVYGERDCSYCPVVKKYGQAISVFNIGNDFPENPFPAGGSGNHPCCVTRYSLVSPTKLIDMDTGTSYTVATYNNMKQWIWFGRCVNNGAVCINQGRCFEQWDYPTEILVENPNNKPPYIFKEYHYPRQCLCSQ